MSLEALVATSAGDLDVSAELAIEAGEIVVLLGPNGAGKTTVLRALAGLLPLTRGRTVLDATVLEDVERGLRVPAERRPIGFVFQDYLLFPHLSVLDNVAFGLRARGRGRPQALAIAQEWLARMGLERHSGARPRQLSGGEAQRVALARALASGPRLLLLDEPLSALDAGARTRLRRDLRRHLASFEGVRLMVTHDPVEALLMGDRLIVLEQGTIVQSGSMADLRARPRSPYVANLVGLNLYRGRASGDAVELPLGSRLVSASSATGDVFATVHPHAVSLYRARPEGSPRNVWRGPIEEIDLEGERARVEIGGAIPIVAEVTMGALMDLELRPGDDVWVSFKATEVNVYPV